MVRKLRWPWIKSQWHGRSLTDRQGQSPWCQRHCSAPRVKRGPVWDIWDRPRSDPHEGKSGCSSLVLFVFLFLYEASIRPSCRAQGMDFELFHVSLSDMEQPVNPPADRFSFWEAQQIPIQRTLKKRPCFLVPQAAGFYYYFYVDRTGYGVQNCLMSFVNRVHIIISLANNMTGR